MAHDQAKQNVESVSKKYPESASRLRQELADGLVNLPISAAERAEAVSELERLATMLEAKAEWWLTGEGDAPEF